MKPVSFLFHKSVSSLKFGSVPGEVPTPSASEDPLKQIIETFPPIQNVREFYETLKSFRSPTKLYPAVSKFPLARVRTPQQIALDEGKVKTLIDFLEKDKGKTVAMEVVSLKERFRNRETLNFGNGLSIILTFQSQNMDPAARSEIPMLMVFDKSTDPSAPVYSTQKQITDESREIGPKGIVSKTALHNAERIENMLIKRKR